MRCVFLSLSLINMNVSNKIARCIVFFLCLISYNLFSQKSRDQLEKDKKDNLKKIEEVNSILQETSQDKHTSIGQLQAIKQKIATTQQIIESMNEEILLLDGETSELGSIAFSLQKDLDTLKQEYAEMVYVAYKSSNAYNRLLFIFSSADFYQLSRRLSYLNHYSEERVLQVKQINKVKNTLLKQHDLLRAKMEEKNRVLALQRKEKEGLEELKTQRATLIKSLSLKEKELKKELQERKKAVQELEKMIAKIIEEEIRAEAKRIEAEKQKAKASKVKKVPEPNQLATSFEASKSKLAWPVASGFISQKFGVQEHALLEGVKLDNFGIDIQTNKEEPIRTVFDGKVKYVGFIPGLGHTVMLQHGVYFTVYAKLSSVTVKKNQLVKAKEIIGEVLTDKNGISELHFEIWKNMARLDPEQWLNRK